MMAIDKSSNCNDRNIVIVYHGLDHRKKENLPQTHTDAHRQRGKDGRLEDKRLGR